VDATARHEPVNEELVNIVAIDSDNSEKRKYRRFGVQYGAFVASESNAAIFGPMLNISKGGLAFQYYANDSSQLKDEDELAIFMNSNGYYLGSVPFKTVSNLESSEKNPFSTISMRICGIQFGALTEEQMDLLDYFLESHTVKA